MTPVELTRKLIAMPSANPPGNEREIARFLGELLERGGYTIAYHEFDDMRTSLVATLKGKGTKRPICFSGHIDTVPIGESPWRVDPFKGEIEGDRLYGRGASDMKGGVAAMVIAALQMAEEPEGEGDIVLALTAGEETGCSGALDLADRQKRMGNVLPQAGALVVGEPTDNYPMLGHKGAFWLEVETNGVAAHGSMPEQGVNAIYLMAEAVLKLKEHSFAVAPHPVLGSPTLNVGTLRAGTAVNIVAEKAVAGIDLRTLPDQGIDGICRNLKAELGEKATLRLLNGAQSVWTDPDDPWVVSVFDILEKMWKERPEPRGVTYFTDASALRSAMNAPPTLILGPGEPSQAHKVNESCSVSKLEDALEIYTAIMKSWRQ